MYASRFLSPGPLRWVSRRLPGRPAGRCRKSRSARVPPCEVRHRTRPRSRLCTRLVARPGRSRRPRWSRRGPAGPTAPATPDFPLCARIALGAHRSGPYSRNRKTSGRPKSVLRPDECARIQFLSEIAALSAKQTVTWAHRTIGVKNTLTAAGAQMVEEAFQSRMTALESGTGEEGELSTPTAEVNKPAPADVPPVGHMNRAPRPRSNRQEIDKSTLPWPEPRRIRDKAHIKFVCRQQCLSSGSALPCPPS
jgi:hypothetical protein